MRFILILVTHQGHDQQIDDDDDAQSPGHRNRYQKNGGFGMQSVDAPEKPLTTSVEPTRVFCETAEILLVSRIFIIFKIIACPKK